MSEDLAMPYAPCWKRLLDLEIQRILDALPTSIEKPISRMIIFNKAVTANVNFLGTVAGNKLKALNAPCIFRIYIALSVSGVFSVQRTSPTSSTAVVENMNQGVALTANAGYMFDILVDEGDSIDFQTTVSATLLKLSVVEKDDAK